MRTVEVSDSRFSPMFRGPQVREYNEELEVENEFLTDVWQSIAVRAHESLAVVVDVTNSLRLTICHVWHLAYATAGQVEMVRIGVGLPG
jgi:hypothetical protein